MSRHPAMKAAWLAMMPMDRPPTRAKPVTMFRAHRGWTSQKSPSSTTLRITSRTS